MLSVGLATIGVCVFCAFTSVGALFILYKGDFKDKYMEDFIEYLKKHSDDKIDVNCIDIRLELKKYNYKKMINTGFYQREKYGNSYLDTDEVSGPGYIFYDGHNTGYSIDYHIPLRYVPFLSEFSKGYYRIMKDGIYTGYDLRYEKERLGNFLYYNGERYQKQSSDNTNDSSSSCYDSSSPSESTSSSQVENSTNSNKNSVKKKGISFGAIIFIVIAIIVLFKYCGS